MKSKFLLISASLLLNFGNVYAEEKTTTQPTTQETPSTSEPVKLKNYIEIEGGTSTAKYKSSVDWRLQDIDDPSIIYGNKDLQSTPDSPTGYSKFAQEDSASAQIKITYLRSITDKFRLSVGINYDTTNTTLKDEYNFGSFNPSNLSENYEFSTQNYGGLSFGGEYDLYKNEKFSLFAIAVANINVSNISLKVKESALVDKTTTNTSAGQYVYINVPAGKYSGRSTGDVCRAKGSAVYSDYRHVGEQIRGTLSLGGGIVEIGNYMTCQGIATVSTDVTTTSQVTNTYESSELAIYVPIEFGLGAQYNITDKLALVGKAKYITGYNLSASLDLNPNGKEDSVFLKGDKISSKLDVSGAPKFDLALRYAF